MRPPTVDVVIVQMIQIKAKSLIRHVKWVYECVIVLLFKLSSALIGISQTVHMLLSPISIHAPQIPFPFPISHSLSQKSAHWSLTKFPKKKIQIFIHRGTAYCFPSSPSHSVCFCHDFVWAQIIINNIWKQQLGRRCFTFFYLTKRELAMVDIFISFRLFCACVVRIIL